MTRCLVRALLVCVLPTLRIYGLDDGPSPAWPIGYDDLEAHYGQAELIWGVRGDGTEDPMEPPRTAPYPFPALEHEPDVAVLADRLRDRGYTHTPYQWALHRETAETVCAAITATDLRARCTRNATQTYGAPPRPSQSERLPLETDAYAERLLTDPSGRVVTGVDVRLRGELRRATAAQFVVCAGGVNTAALFLRGPTQHTRPGSRTPLTRSAATTSSTATRRFRALIQGG